MASTGRGRLYAHTKGKVVLYLPAAVIKDSAFPFKVGQQVEVRIQGGRLSVSRLRKD